MSCAIAEDLFDWHITTAFFSMYLCVLATSHERKDIFMLVYSVISNIKRQIRIQIKYEYQTFNLL